MSDSDQKQETGGGNGGGDTAVLEPPPPKVKPAAPKADPRNKPKRQPPYAVIVENDDDHTYEYVILGLCKVCGISTERAFQLASQIDKQGQAAVWTGALEVAELKRDQILGLGPDFFARKPVNYPLGVRLEPLPQ